MLNAPLQQPAEVVRIEPETLWLSAMPQSQCAGCALKSGCGQTWRQQLAQWRGWGRLREVPVRRDAVAHLPDLQVGDRVWLAVPQGAVLSGSIQLYGVPLATLLLGTAWVSALGVSDAMLAGISLGLFALSVLAVKRWRAVRDHRLELRVLSRVEALPFGSKRPVKPI